MDTIREMQLTELRNIEEQIQDLENGPWVRIARQYEQIKAKRLAYLEELKQQARFGQKLHDMGWAYSPEVGYAEA